MRSDTASAAFKSTAASAWWVYLDVTDAFLVAEQRSNSEFTVPEIGGDRREAVPQRVRGHVRWGSSARLAMRSQIL